MTDLVGKIINRSRNIRLQILGTYSDFVMFFLLRIKGVSVGSKIHSNLIGINRKCILSTHSSTAKIIIGKDSAFSGTVIGSKEKIIIGNNLLCGANTLITDFDWHGLDPQRRLSYSGDSKEIIIGDNVFIGYGAVILKGVSIGDNTVIGANSVVTKSIPANVIAGGNPCKVIKSLQ